MDRLSIYTSNKNKEEQIMQGKEFKGGVYE